MCLERGFIITMHGRVSFADFPRVQTGPENPLKVEKDETAQLECGVDSKPAVNTVKWTRNGRFIDTNFKHTIPRVSLDDAGAYVCSADNGLGQVGKQELLLDVLHAPVVTLPARREVKERESVEIECVVNANPRPASIRWHKVGDDSFNQNGPVLKLSGVTARHNGDYVCTATNYVEPTGRPKSVRTGNATISINVRHAPGKAFITPERPTAVDGKRVVLTCGASPPGYPAPEYRWWKEGTESSTLARGAEFTIEHARLSTAGKYFCQPANELGEGGVASVFLDVYQEPKLITHLKDTVTKRAGDTGFHITCSAKGKPKPAVRWFKDGREITADSEMFEISTSGQEAIPNMGATVLSTLKYHGPERISNSQIMPTDRGVYTCRFENEVAAAETTMLLRIEHSPVVVHQHNRVAFDVGEPALISCKMQAFPTPTFDWSYGNSVLPNGGQFFDANTTALQDDIYETVLKIKKVSDRSYGEYICKGSNTMGSKRTVIKLQAKGKPERPMNVRSVQTSYDTITLAWDEGFDGGFSNNFFDVQYRRQGDNSSPRYAECAHRNPCNITGLDQHTQYMVQVKARNIKGESKFSREVRVNVKLCRMKLIIIILIIRLLS